MEPIQSDVQSEVKPDLIELSQVGMSDVQISLELKGLFIPAQLSVAVNLTAGHRGIHMSRLYETVIKEIHMQSLDRLNWWSIMTLLINGQKGLSQTAVLKLNFNLPLQREALKSGLVGHRNYPLSIQLFQSEIADVKQNIYQQDFEILYSSTCPQSTQLAKELTKNYFASRNDQDVLDWVREQKNFIATPHAQRSRMKISLQSESSQLLNLDQWIGAFENLLKTPVQTSVKKADEMEFARLNGENPMFCEDALRTVALFLNQHLSSGSLLSAYKVETSHEESLHPHNAVGVVKSKNYVQI